MVLFAVCLESLPLVRPQSAGQRGFSFIEVSIVLVIVGLLLALSAEFAGNYLERQRYAAASSKLTGVEQALIRFVSVTKRLPCADSNGDGVEDGAPGSCAAHGDASVGTIPYTTIGIARDVATDPLGNRFAYAVDEKLTDDTHPAGMEITEDQAGLNGMGLLIQEGGVTVLDPSATPMPTGAAYVLMADHWYDDPSTSNVDETLENAIGTATGDDGTSYTAVILGAYLISELVRRPTVAEVAGEADSWSTP